MCSKVSELKYFVTSNIQYNSSQKKNSCTIYFKCRACQVISVTSLFSYILIIYHVKVLQLFGLPKLSMSVFIEGNYSINNNLNDCSNVLHAFLLRVCIEPPLHFMAWIHLWSFKHILLITKQSFFCIRACFNGKSKLSNSSYSEQLQ